MVYHELSSEVKVYYVDKPGASAKDWRTSHCFLYWVETAVGRVEAAAEERPVARILFQCATRDAGDHHPHRRLRDSPQGHFMRQNEAHAHFGDSYRVLKIVVR